jgi:hypothetical protein
MRLILWSRFLFGNQIFAELVLFAFMEPEGLLLCSQDPVTNLGPEEM